MGKLFDPQLIIEYLPQIMKGLPTTLLIFVTVIFLSFVFGIIGAAVKVTKLPVLYQLNRVIGGYVLNVPTVVQLFLIYYVLPVAIYNITGINATRWDAVIFAIATFALEKSVSMSEGIASALLSINRGQYEAAYSIGLTRIQTVRNIIFPQAFRVMLPVFEMISCTLFKETTMAYMLGISDVMSRAKFMGSRIDHKLEAYIGAALIFLLINLSLIIFFKCLENKFSFGIRTVN
ncbi:L-cystine transport system permease protein [Butyrivibrio sp. ob235]|uniref:amino acid ABC transporter permease n=1 Tax=Butyrivibrio sp. ob235 TaxID=1761780 RepID=UPI0008CC2E9E|nr:amino acid ABC transporter permease [Butyrivibrio sp. ob235]SEL03964.1 L-cystine transport system permease protein [Butyrivibrio sp. ob235]